MLSSRRPQTEQRKLEIPRKKFKLESIGPLEIDVAGNGWDEFAVSFPRRADQVELSIWQVGLLAPALVVRDTSGRLRPVAGLKRIIALQAVSPEPQPFLVAERSAVEPLELLCCGLIDNTCGRGLNPVELALAAQKLRAFASGREELIDAARRVGLLADDQALRRQEELLSLPEKVMLALADGGIDVGAAFQLTQMSPQDAESVFRAACVRASCTVSQLREIIADCREVCLSERCTSEELLATQPVQTLLNNARLNKRQKASALRDLLHAMRSPITSRMEQMWRERCRACELPAEVAATHHRFFEDDDIQLRISASSVSQLTAAVHAILKAIEAGKAGKLFTVAQDMLEEVEREQSGPCPEEEREPG